MNVDSLVVALWLYAILCLLCVGFFLLGGLSATVAALTEKRYVRNLVPLDPDGQALSPNDPGPHPYLDLANELAGQGGFEFGGIFARAKKGATKFRMALWRSPKRDILLVVFIGEVGGPLHVELTLFISHIGSRYLITTDDFSEDDISGLLDYEVHSRHDFLQSLDNEVHQAAHFQKLLARHEERLAEQKSKPTLFQATDMSEDLNTMRMKQARHMAELGYSQFLDNEHTIWRYTPKGAVRIVFRSYLKIFASKMRRRGAGKKISSHLGGVMLALALLPKMTLRTEDWPQWRGPNQDAVWHETGPMESFPARTG